MLLSLRPLAVVPMPFCVSTQKRGDLSLQHCDILLIHGCFLFKPWSLKLFLSLSEILANSHVPTPHRRVTTCCPQHK